MPINKQEQIQTPDFAAGDVLVIGDAQVFIDHVAIHGELFQLHKIEGVAVATRGGSADRVLNFVFWAGAIAVGLGVAEFWASGWVFHKGAVFWIIGGLAGLLYSIARTASTVEAVSVLIRTGTREIVVLTTSEPQAAADARDGLNQAIIAARARRDDRR